MGGGIMPGGGIMGGGSIPGLGWPTLNAAATGKRGKIRLTVFLCNTESWEALEQGWIRLITSGRNRQYH